MTAKAVAPLFLVFSVACSRTGTSSGPPRALEPCDDAVPVTGDPSPFDSVYIVGVNASSDVQAEAARLSAECGFTVRQVFSLGQGFSAALGPVELGCVRCDPSVTSVYGNTVLYPQ